MIVMVLGSACESEMTSTLLACSEIKSTLKEFQDQVQPTLPNPETFDTMNYLVVGNPDAEEAILFIPGTNAVLPDWPVQLFTNSTASPDLKREFPKAQNSLCSEFALIFIDFPGVGGSQLGGTLTFKTVALDISDVVTAVVNNFGINIKKLHLFGWSLGSLVALRFAEDNPTDISIGTLFLSGTKPGGGADGNPAKCVTQAFDLIKTVQSLELQKTLIRLMFPYENQEAYNGLSDSCTSIDKSTFEPNITLNPCKISDLCDTTPCPPEEMCGRALDLFVDNRTSSSKWNGGVPNPVYIQERDMVESYNVCNCFPDDQSCSCPSSNPDLNPDDGGVCNCLKLAPNVAVCFSENSESELGCADLTTAERMVVFNGKEDIFIQWLYGEFLVEGYNKIEDGFANLVNYDEDQGMQAGHGLPLQSPAWMQDQIYNHLR